MHHLTVDPTGYRPSRFFGEDAVKRRVFEVRLRDLVSQARSAAVILVAAAVFAASAVGQGEFESPEPVLLTEPRSMTALAVSPENWNGQVPQVTSGTFRPGSRVVVFVTNVELAPGEGANAFRIFAEGQDGRRYRFEVESIRRISKRSSIYGLTARIHDPSGYDGQPTAGGELTMRVSWRGNASNRTLLALGKRSGTGGQDQGSRGSSDVPAQAGRLSAGGDRKRFMEQASFGPNAELDFRLRQIGIRRWIEEQFHKPYPTFPYPNFPLKPFEGDTGCGVLGTSPEVDRCHRDHYWNYQNPKWLMQEALYGDDQLRRRVSWALHQIWVVANGNLGQQRAVQEYIEVLDRNAFGNYRDLMEEMTLNPAMGLYLDTIYSTRQNPNENYPRELLQLFTTGSYTLNIDGTFVIDANGRRVQTYDQDRIDQFTKVFTGWRHCNNGTNPACPNAAVGAANYIDPIYLVFPDEHDQTAKSLFNYPGAPNSTIAACGNCSTDAARRAYAADSLDRALDNIFHHPNVGPFIGKILIQHLVTSDPSPAYVSRVASAFNDNGSGVRGDMKAVIRAILLDPEARGSRKTEPTYGKLRDPLLYMTAFLRAFNVRAGRVDSTGSPATAPASCQGKSDGVFEWIIRDMGLDVWNPPSVFSYYPPDNVVPGTDILGPEFAIANTSSSFERNNQILFFLFGGLGFNPVTSANPYPYIPCGTSVDLSEVAAWAAADPTGNALVEGLNTKLMHGTMSEAMKSKIREAVNFNVPAADKAWQAVFLAVTSSQYQIQR